MGVKDNMNLRVFTEPTFWYVYGLADAKIQRHYDSTWPMLGRGMRYLSTLRVRQVQGLDRVTVELKDLL